MTSINLSTLKSLGQPIELWEVITLLLDVYTIEEKHERVKIRAVEMRPLGPMYITRDAVLTIVNMTLYLFNKLAEGQEEFEPNISYFKFLVGIYLTLGVDSNVFLRPRDTFKFCRVDLIEGTVVVGDRNEGHMGMYEDFLNIYNKYLLPIAKEVIIRRRGGLHRGPETKLNIPEALQLEIEDYAIGHNRLVNPILRGLPGSPRMGFSRSKSPRGKPSKNKKKKSK